ncbi:MAG: ATP-binding protein [Anaerolineales bacterium]
MRVAKISEEDALSVCARDESHFFDRKALEVTGRKIQKVAVAFANSDGGEIVVGVLDGSDEPDAAKRWKGAADLEVFNGLLQALFEVTPTLDVTYEALLSEGRPGYVLRVLVEKGSQVHKTAAGKVYVRYGPQSLPVDDPDRLAELSFAKGATSFEDTTVESLPPEDIMESDLLRIFLEGYSPKTDPLDFLVNSHLLEHKTWSPTCASVLLFYPAPSGAMPRKCSVRITRYETKEEDPERDHLGEQRTIEGPLYSLIHAASAAISELMSSISTWTTEGMKLVDYPPETIWEILANAIIHRDYSVSDDVQVMIFDNRIEVVSPGKLPGYVNVENILDARYSRNPKIVRTLNRYADPPNRDLGEGLNTAFQKMKEWKLQSPEISEVNNYVRVVIPHTPLATPQEAIMEFLEHNKTIRNAEARELTGIKSENAVKRVFLKLAEADLIERVPKLRGPLSRWQKKK